MKNEIKEKSNEKNMKYQKNRSGNPNNMCMIEIVCYCEKKESIGAMSNNILELTELLKPWFQIINIK